MAISDIYSKRTKRKSGLQADIFEYEAIPPELRVQINYIIDDLLPRNYQGTHNNSLYEGIVHDLAREYGVERLAKANTEYLELFAFIKEADGAQVLDVIEVAFRHALKDYPYPHSVATR